MYRSAIINKKIDCKKPLVTRRSYNYLNEDEKLIEALAKQQTDFLKSHIMMRLNQVEPIKQPVFLKHLNFILCQE